MSTLSIANQLRVLLAVALLGTLALLATLGYATKQVDLRVRQVSEQTLQVMTHLNDIRMVSTEIGIAINSAPPPAPEAFAATLEKLRYHLAAYSRYVDQYFPSEREMRDTIVGHGSALARDMAPYAAPSGAPFPDNDKALGAFRRDLLALLSAVDEAMRNEQTEVGERMDEVTAAMGRTDVIVWAGFLALAGLIIAIAAYISRRLVSRIATLREATRNVGETDFAVRLKDRGRDELSDLARVFDDMTQRLGEVMERRDLAEDELRQMKERLEKLVLSRTRELNAAKEQAEFATRAKSKFLSSMSHELRTPLNAIFGFTQLIQLKKLSATAQDEYLEIIIENCHRLLAMIDQLLVLSSISDVPLNLTVSRVSLAKALESGIARSAILAGEYGITIRNETKQAALPEVLADEEHLAKIVTNLLSNAIKYNRPETGHVVIRAESISDAVHRVIIEDTGSGFVEEYPGQALEPFERLHHYGGAIDGSGVGLTIVNSFLNNIEGQLGYRSTPGEGSRFWFDLKVAQETT